jgi:uncharacterized membrane protein
MHHHNYESSVAFIAKLCTEQYFMHGWMRGVGFVLGLFVGYFLCIATSYVLAFLFLAMQAVVAKEEERNDEPPWH